VKKKIAVMDTLIPVDRAAHEGVRGSRVRDRPLQQHARQEPASYSVLTARDMIQALKSIDGDEHERSCSSAANLPMAKMADEARARLDKPVIRVTVELSSCFPFSLPTGMPDA